MKAGEKVEKKELVKRAKKGDRDALIELIMDQGDNYYKLAYVYLKSEADSMDALQDTIVILYNNIKKLRKEEAFYSWSKTILVNECKKRLRERKKLISLEDVKEGAFEEKYNTVEDKMEIEMYLSKLSEKHADVIRLRYLLDLDYEEISNILKVSLGTVKSRLSVGLKKLKEIAGVE